ncbi:MAG: hypothetical protein CMJ74_08465 [Planctomycetaceae bacterium]|nr:hypothetical protein [Planctomycetaceae bacterium]
MRAFPIFSKFFSRANRPGGQQDLTSADSSDFYFKTDLTLWIFNRANTVTSRQSRLICRKINKDIETRDWPAV